MFQNFYYAHVFLISFYHPIDDSTVELFKKLLDKNGMYYSKLEKTSDGKAIEVILGVEEGDGYYDSYIEIPIHIVSKGRAATEYFPAEGIEISGYFDSTKEMLASILSDFFRDNDLIIDVEEETFDAYDYLIENAIEELSY